MWYVKKGTEKGPDGRYKAIHVMGIAGLQNKLINILEKQPCVDDMMEHFNTTRKDVLKEIETHGKIVWPHEE